MIIDRFEIRVKNTVSLKLRVEHLNYPVSLRLSHLWSLFARKYAKDDRVFMGIMNEPHNRKLDSLEYHRLSNPFLDAMSFKTQLAELHQSSPALLLNVSSQID